MTFDLNLSTKESLVFCKDNCYFVDAQKLRDTSNQYRHKEAKDIFGNSIRAKIAM